MCISRLCLKLNIFFLSTRMMTKYQYIWKWIPACKEYSLLTLEPKLLFEYGFNNFNNLLLLFFILLNSLHCASKSGHKLFNFHHLFWTHHLFNIRLNSYCSWVEGVYVTVYVCVLYLFIFSFFALHFYVNNADDYTHIYWCLFRHFNQSLFV